MLVDEYHQELFCLLLKILAKKYGKGTWDSIETVFKIGLIAILALTVHIYYIPFFKKVDNGCAS